MQRSMKEMVGGCCVCSDERGWPENPLVYCDGQNCTVAVHQACYGIVTVPTGPWFCRKCESQERAVRVKCELCPSKDGALKKTDNQNWAHVVCALYIPEVRFGNVTTMEPIILSLIPSERFSKTCYICKDHGKNSKATMGACMQCNKIGCRQQFHVTCAQALGLLCEEAGNYLDNVKYCGYCQHHYSKLKKGGNVKPIPPYKPIHEAGSSDPPSSPEKEADGQLNPSTQMTVVTVPTSSAIKSTQSSMMQPMSSVGATGATTSSSSSSASVPFPSTKQRKSDTTIGKTSPHNTITGLGVTGAGTSQTIMAQSHLNSSSVISNNLSKTAGTTSGRDKDGKHGKNVSKTGSSGSNSARDPKESKMSKSNKGGGASKHDHLHDTTQLSNSTGLIGGLMGPSTHPPKELTTINSEVIGAKFTTANFNETVLVNSDYTMDKTSQPIIGQSGSATITTIAKKRKADSGKLTGNMSTEDINKDLIKDVSVTLVPLPLDKTTSVDSLLDDKMNKKQKTDSIAIPTISAPNELNIQNVSPNFPLQQPQFTHPTGHISIQKQMLSKAHLQTPLVKLSTNDIRLHQTATNSYNPSPTPQSTAGGQATASTVSTIQSTTPSLVVSVPLSTANVAGVNLPPITNPSIVTNQSFTTTGPPLATMNRHDQVIVANRSSPVTHPINHPLIPDHLIGERQSPIVRTATSSPIPTHQQQQQQQRLSASEQGGVLHRSSPIDHPPHLVSNISTLESGGLKITYDKQPQSRISQLVHDETGGSGRRSRTPEANVMPTSYSTTSFGGLKFSYEAQSTPTNPGTGQSQAGSNLPTITSSENPSAIKDSPPSSPEPGKKKLSPPAVPPVGSDAKDFKIFQNGMVSATHMFGNQLNTSSSVGQKMSDQLNMEIESHSVYSASSLDSGTQFVGPTFPGKLQANIRSSLAQTAASQQQSLPSMLGGMAMPTALGNTPQSLESLLERQWEQGSHFLMEQAQHFDIAALLTCLYQLRTENVKLEEHVSHLVSRRDHLIAANARLAIPLNQQPTTQQERVMNNMHSNGPIDGPPNATIPNRSIRSHNFNVQQHTSQQSQLMENGIDFRPNHPQQQSNQSSNLRQISSAPIISTSNQMITQPNNGSNLYTNHMSSSNPDPNSSDNHFVQPSLSQQQGGVTFSINTNQPNPNQRTSNQINQS